MAKIIDIRLAGCLACVLVIVGISSIGTVSALGVGESDNIEIISNTYAPLSDWVYGYDDNIYIRKYSSFEPTVSIGSSPVIFQDDFNDANADGWQFTFAHDPRHLPPNTYVYGNWRVENGELVQDDGTDHQIALVEGLSLTDQVIEAKVKCNPDAGYAGVMVWYHDVNNWVNVFIYPKFST